MGNLINLSDDWQRSRSLVEAKLNQHDSALNGDDGVVSKVERFITRHDANEQALEKIQAERHRENSDKITKQNVYLAFVAVMVSIGTLVLLALGTYVAIREYERKASALTSNTMIQEAQDATGPTFSR